MGVFETKITRSKGTAMLFTKQTTIGSQSGLPHEIHRCSSKCYETAGGQSLRTKFDLWKFYSPLSYKDV